MIKTKEDLNDCYAVRADKEVFELFMQKCEEFGIKWHGGCEPRRVVYGLAVVYDGDRLAHGSECSFVGSKKLTLADFKPQPKTRTEYKPVTMRDYEALQKFHSGKEFYHKPEYARNHNLVSNVETLIQAHVGGWLYTKEEVKIDWKVEATKFISENETTEEECIWTVDGVDLTDESFIKLCYLVTELTKD